MKDKKFYTVYDSVEYIRGKFGYLNEYDFSFNNIEVFHQGIGWTIDIFSSICKIRFAMDRGEISIKFIPIAFNNNEWINLDLLVYYLSNKNEKIGIENNLQSYPVQLDRLSSFLERYIDKIMIIITNIDENIDKLNQYSHELNLFYISNLDQLFDK